MSASSDIPKDRAREAYRIGINQIQKELLRESAREVRGIPVSVADKLTAGEIVSDKELASIFPEGLMETYIAKRKPIDDYYRAQGVGTLTEFQNHSVETREFNTQAFFDHHEKPSARAHRLGDAAPVALEDDRSNAQKLADLKRENLALEKQIIEINSKLDEKRKDLAIVALEMKQLTPQTKSGTIASKAKAQTELEKAKAKLDQLQAEIAPLNTKLDALNADLQVNNAAIAGPKAQKAEGLQVRGGRINELVNRHAEAKEELKAARSKTQVDIAQENLEQSRSSHASQAAVENAQVDQAIQGEIQRNTAAERGLVGKLGPIVKEREQSKVNLADIARRHEARMAGIEASASAETEQFGAQSNFRKEELREAWVEYNQTMFNRAVEKAIEGGKPYSEEEIQNIKSNIADQGFLTDLKTTVPGIKDFDEFVTGLDFNRALGNYGAARREFSGPDSPNVQLLDRKAVLEGRQHLGTELGHSARMAPHMSLKSGEARKTTLMDEGHMLKLGARTAETDRLTTFVNEAEQDPVVKSYVKMNDAGNVLSQATQNVAVATEIKPLEEVGMHQSSRMRPDPELEKMAREIAAKEVESGNEVHGKHTAAVTETAKSSGKKLLGEIVAKKEAEHQARMAEVEERKDKIIDGIVNRSVEFQTPKQIADIQAGKRDVIFGTQGAPGRTVDDRMVPVDALVNQMFPPARAPVRAVVAQTVEEKAVAEHKTVEEVKQEIQAKAEKGLSVGVCTTCDGVGCQSSVKSIYQINEAGLPEKIDQQFAEELISNGRVGYIPRSNIEDFDAQHRDNQSVMAERIGNVELLLIQELVILERKGTNVGNSKNHLRFQPANEEIKLEFEKRLKQMPELDQNYRSGPRPERFQQNVDRVKREQQAAAPGLHASALAAERAATGPGGPGMPG